MRRLFLCAALTAFLGGAALATSAAAAESVRRGWTPLPRCAPCGESPGLKVVQFASPNVGWLAGSFGVAWTDNGGTSWQLARGLPGAVERASVNGSRGVAVGSFEGLAVSGDGGRTWKQYRPIPGKVYDVQALPDRLLAATASQLYSSTDGIVWKAVGHFAGGDTYGSRIHFADATHGTMVSAVQMSTTHDGGRTWRAARTNTYYTSLRLGVFTRSASSAFAVGVSGKGPSEYFMERVDGTAFADVTGLPTPATVYRGLSDVAFTGDIGYAVGWEGVLLRSTDGGTTWVSETPPPSYERTTFRGVATLSADRAIAVTYGGGIVTRDAPVLTDVSHPYRPLGIGLAVLGGAALAGAGARVVVARPDLVAGALGLAGIVAAGSGTAAITVSRDTVPGVSVLVQQEPAGAGLTLVSGTPSPTATATSSPSATVSTTPTPTRTTSAPTTAPTTNPPTVRPTTRPPATTKPPGTFKVTPANLAQTCSPNQELGQFTITLKNGTSSPVVWTLEFDLATNGQDPWAGAQQQSGTLAAGQSKTLAIYPNGQAVCGGLNGPTDFRIRVRQDTQSTVAGPVLGTVTDRVSPA